MFLAIRSSLSLDCDLLSISSADLCYVRELPPKPLMANASGLNSKELRKNLWGIVIGAVRLPVAKALAGSGGSGGQAQAGPEAAQQG